MGGSSSKEADRGSKYTPPKPVEKEDYSRPLPYEKLPADLQKLVDKDDESLWDSVYEGQ